MKKFTCVQDIGDLNRPLQKHLKSRTIASNMSDWAGIRH